ncbi:zinc-dependent alcohol dehydrogenase family protein [Mesorhizobium sp. B4-1-1]|uniref:zinc-dependent alcohol dehydrogenase family protein n=1 Tax=Mesorhizobium sp. B4-1-1 TaxID=2589890 RepID=UPI00112839E2|nr:zinc-dependent alcohol dehydrogenase family protein [Mesorhizobium sp. B4-1-1]TPI22395.1 zinc-dependent alcohol dehydrogenase family protein [Mesorhizobium sp. B4-1-1]
MKAIVFHDRGIVQETEVPVPALRPGHAMVRVQAAGLCHTDIEVLHGRYGKGVFPLVPGHEYAGVVELVADDVSGIRPGDRVVIDPNITCGQCPQCRKGLTNLCAHLKAYGVTENGGFAQFSVVDARHLHHIGQLPFDLAALAEPLACVMNGLGAAGVLGQSGLPQSALVIGAGPIGLLLANSLRTIGVARVAVADRNDNRLAMVQAFGFEPFAAGSDALRQEQQAFDFVADATGVVAVVEGMIQYVADGGAALIFGVCPPDSRASFAPFELFRRQIRLAGSHSLNRNIPQALDLLTRDLTISKLVTHRLPLAEMVPFFTKGGDPTTMKVQFVAAAAG